MYVGSGVLTAVIMKSLIVWNITPCSSVENNFEILTLNGLHVVTIQNIPRTRIFICDIEVGFKFLYQREHFLTKMVFSL
jgi:hypothetical protein